MLTELQEKKIRHLFRVFDMNNDGVLDKNEYINLFSGLAETIGYRNNQYSYKKLQKLPFLIWRKMHSFFECDLNKNINQDQWVEWANHVLKELNSNPQAKENILSFYFKIFDILDINNNKFISLNNYKKCFNYFRLKGNPDAIFYRIDIEKKGQISRKNFGQLFLEYYGQDIDAPGNYLWGIFID